MLKAFVLAGHFMTLLPCDIPGHLKENCYLETITDDNHVTDVISIGNKIFIATQEEEKTS